jgi:uncharacterized protein (TIGR02391 family)
MGVPVLSSNQIEKISYILGDEVTGRKISSIFQQMKISDTSGESTKWRKINHIFYNLQVRDKACSRFLDFIRIILEPSSYINRVDDFKSICSQLNTILAFSGLSYGEDGKFFIVDTANTLDEAHKRAKTLQSKFQGRRIHDEVLKYCKPELLQDNYFHAVFEASKGLAQRIRNMASVEGDGAGLVDKVFSIEKPILAFNTLQTDTEKSEHKGFAMLLKGCFASIRNPLAHEPKILWNGENDAVDYLSMISMLNRKLDDAVKTNIRYSAT